MRVISLKHDHANSSDALIAKSFGRLFRFSDYHRAYAHFAGELLLLNILLVEKMFMPPQIFYTTGKDSFKDLHDFNPHVASSMKINEDDKDFYLICTDENVSEHQYRRRLEQLRRSFTFNKNSMGLPVHMDVFGDPVNNIPDIKEAEFSDFSHLMRLPGTVLYASKETLSRLNVSEDDPGEVMLVELQNMPEFLSQREDYGTFSSCANMMVPEHIRLEYCHGEEEGEDDEDSSPDDQSVGDGYKDCPPSEGDSSEESFCFVDHDDLIDDVAVEADETIQYTPPEEASRPSSTNKRRFSLFRWRR